MEMQNKKLKKKIMYEREENSWNIEPNKTKGSLETLNQRK